MKTGPVHTAGQAARPMAGEADTPVSNDDLHAAVEALRAGGVVGLPTETVYGLAANAADEAAVASIYRIKGRPADHPLIVHVADIDAARQWAEWTPAAQRLAEAFWPGPLSLVLRRRQEAPAWACGGQPTIALRSSSHPVFQALMRALKPFGITGLAAPSANPFGRISPSRAAHVRAGLGEAVPVVLEGGSAEIGLESTIVDLSRDVPVLLRPGHISLAALEQCLGEPVRAADLLALAGEDADAPRVPGALPSHYAPSVPVLLLDADQLGAALAEARQEGEAVALWSTRPPEPQAGLFWRRRPVDAAGAARDLYDTLHQLDALPVSRILVERPLAGPDWRALNDRLERAAAA
ncbi:MAG: L-threonylcarbamoyladenylate synthase [Lautropia sp.]|nr:L-threonylcarbamoyladenylate synthase [Lautropia sp.]